MSRFKHIASFPLIQPRHLRRTLGDTLLALVSTSAVTMILYGFHLYPRIPNISLVYLVMVLALASTRGLYPAVLSSVVAFLSFDFFLVEPFYTFSISRPEEWLALFVFLCTAIITGQLASALRLRAQQARAREQETRLLYELLRDTDNEDDLDYQLGVVASKMAEVFRARGVRDCLILLPDEQGQPVLRACASAPVEDAHLAADELTTAAWVLREGEAVDFYPLEFQGKSTLQLSVIRRTSTLQAAQRARRFFPLKTSQGVGGVLCLVTEEDPGHFSQEQRLGSEASRTDPRSTFFWTCLEQAAAMIDHARLRRENLRVEILQRTDALRAALLSSVSHDLRTPLTSIKAAASSLLQEDVSWSEEERSSFAQAIEQEADRLNRLVENLLDLSRIEGGALHPEKEWYPLDELVHDVLGRIQPLVQGREVKAILPTSLPPLELDYLMIDQVLTNLIENALRYTPAGSPIEIVAETLETEVRLSVADRGPGIPVNDLEHIFDKFYRVKSGVRAMSGTGIGLAVCRGLMEAHGGRIWAENRQGGGTSICLALPLHPANHLLANREESRA